MGKIKDLEKRIKELEDNKKIADDRKYSLYNLLSEKQEEINDIRDNFIKELLELLKIGLARNCNKEEVKANTICKAKHLKLDNAKENEEGAKAFPWTPDEAKENK